MYVVVMRFQSANQLGNKTQRALRRWPVEMENKKNSDFETVCAKIADDNEEQRRKKRMRENSARYRKNKKVREEMKTQELDRLRCENQVLREKLATLERRWNQEGKNKSEFNKSQEIQETC